jgi:hypothetical protein
MELTTPFLYILLGGFAGGAVRGLSGWIRSWSQNGASFNPWYFGGTVLVSGIVGLAAAYAANGAGLPFFGVVINPALALIIGYAGGDFLENVFRIFFLKKA